MSTFPTPPSDENQPENSSEHEASDSSSGPTPVLSADLRTAEEIAWKPLTAHQRRVLGTLMEKSQTTPDAYPMSYAGLTTGCNQKSNRDPITNFDTDDVEVIVDELRELGALAIVQGSGRVTKVRHYAYNWLGLSKAESAIITELLLRGAQTMGELRTRASRMEPIQDLGELQKIFEELKKRNLVVELTPAGRGQVVSHNLYPEWELEKLQSLHQGGGSPAATSVQPTPADSRTNNNTEELTQLRSLVEDLANRVKRLETELGL